MQQTTLLGEPPTLAAQDNITDWCLDEFRRHYEDPSITKDFIWEYLYGVMHAPDWRERYECHLQKSLPRVPFAPQFEPFRVAGRELMDLHIGYETCHEHPDVECQVERNGTWETDIGESRSPDTEYRLEKLKWGKTLDKKDDMSVLEINPQCRLVNIPLSAQNYTISGRTPLAWAIDSLRHKTDKNTGIQDDPNLWQQWADDPFELVRHLRRLVWVSTETARIVDGLPVSLTN